MLDEPGDSLVTPGLDEGTKRATHFPIHLRISPIDLCFPLVFETVLLAAGGGPGRGVARGLLGLSRRRECRADERKFHAKLVGTMTLSYLTKRHNPTRVNDDEKREYRV